MTFVACDKEVVADPPTVATSGDDRFAIGVLVALWSVLEHARAPVRLVVLDCGLSDDHRHRLEHALSGHRNCARWEVIRVTETALPGAPYSDRFPLGSWARVLLPRVLPTVRRLIYLDADVLVRVPIHDLWQVRLAGAAVAAVQDYTIGDLSDGLPVTSAELPEASSVPYFNAGVMVIDLDAWRAADFVERALEWSHARSGTIRYGDQDVINALNAGDRTCLDLTWNVQAGPLHSLRTTIRHPGLVDVARSRQRLEREARIVHFVGRKPWQAEGLRLSWASIRWHLEVMRIIRESRFLTHNESLSLVQSWLSGFCLRVPRALARRAQQRLQRRISAAAT